MEFDVGDFFQASVSVMDDGVEMGGSDRLRRGLLFRHTSNGKPRAKKTDSNIDNASLTIGSKVRIPCTLQIRAFAVVILITLVFALNVTLKAKTPTQKSVDVCCTCTRQH